MKKPDLAHLWFLVRRARKLHRRSLAHRHRRRAAPETRELRKARAAGWMMKPHGLRRGSCTLVLPSNLSMRANYDECAEFLRKFREAAYNRFERLRVDFNSTTTVRPCAALVLAAELDRYRLFYQTRLRAADYYTMDSVVRGLLEDMGLFQLLQAVLPEVPADGVVRPLDKTVPQDQRFIGFEAGNLAEGRLAQRIRHGIEMVAGPLPGQWWPHLYGGLSEAISNAVEHAYKAPDGSDAYQAPAIGKRWWMAGSYTRTSREISLQFYDQGVGIPFTLPRAGMAERLRGLLGHLYLSADDAQMIRAATELGRTATDAAGRGKGLFEMRRLVNRIGGGQLRIISRRGEYIASADGEEQTNVHGSPLGGTLIEWTVSLPAHPQRAPDAHH